MAILGRLNAVTGTIEKVAVDNTPILSKDSLSLRVRTLPTKREKAEMVERAVEVTQPNRSKKVHNLDDLIRSLRR